ncbi:hypothetical protein ACH4NV_31080 [Streptomyces althioticus]|uniref:hypothetical protein n=1 Tax=Streptomyces althioticus group TaxID=2867194 RepID=UPI0017818471|nr:hypothetical protein OG968_09210 [Streptomyces althioticus]WTB95165.1 hypothetical protein OHA53_26585 [Streptomyces althioticus]
MSYTEAFVVPPLKGCVVIVIDATTGAGRGVATRLSAAGAAVAVVGAGHSGRGDDAATNAAFLCKELAGIGLVALPYQADVDRPETFAALPRQIAAELGPVAACVVVVPHDTDDSGLSQAFRTVSAAVAATSPAGAEHIEIDSGRDGTDQEQAAQSVVERLVRRFARAPADGPPHGSGPTSPSTIRTGVQHVDTDRCRR